MKILVLGASGLIGRTIYHHLRGYPQYDVIGTLRANGPYKKRQNNQLKYNIDALDFNKLSALVHEVKPSQIINCIGVTKHVQAQSDSTTLIQLNSVLPHFLAKLSNIVNARLIHISTDCVFSGQTGNYSDEDSTDALDIYGKSKALGELTDVRNLTIRTSTIGHEFGTQHGLLEWFLAQHETCLGYRSAIFSGLPTITLAKILAESVIPRSDLTGLYNLSSHPINKFDLLNKIKFQYQKDIEILPSDDLKINRSLNSDVLKSKIGLVVPTWDELITEMYNMRKV